MTQEDPNNPALSEVPEALDAIDDADADLEEALRETSVVPVTRERAERFYDRLRSSIQRYLDKKGTIAAKSAEWLLLVPDVFILLWRLVNDARVDAKNKMMLGSGLAYYIFPFDIIPEGFMGPTGFVDDLVLAAYMLNRVVRDTDIEVVRQHWSGRDDVLDVIHRVLGMADNMVGSDLIGRVKKMIK